jgi:cytidyltransferase-like protein
MLVHCKESRTGGNSDGDDRRHGVIVRGPLPFIDAGAVRFLERLTDCYDAVWVLPERPLYPPIVGLDDMRWMLGRLACISGVACSLQECPAGFDVLFFPQDLLTPLRATVNTPVGDDEPMAEAWGECEVLAQRPEPLVLLTGCFDLVHLGHFQMIEVASRYGSKPVVAALTTSGIRAQPKNKGDRPLWPMLDRVTVLRAHRARPHVLLFDGPDSLELIRRLRPDYFVKEQRDQHRPIVQQEAQMVERLGGRTVWHSDRHSLTSTALASLIRESTAS